MTKQGTFTGNDNNQVTPTRDIKKFRLGVKEVVGKTIGRNKVVISPEEVFKLAAIGCKDREICDWFGVDENTLNYNFKVELLTGRESLKQSVRKKQIEVALSGNPTMLIWLGKQILGQSDNPLQVDAKILPWVD